MLNFNFVFSLERFNEQLVTFIMRKFFISVLYNLSVLIRTLNLLDISKNYLMHIKIVFKKAEPFWQANVRPILGSWRSLFIPLTLRGKFGRQAGR